MAHEKLPQLCNDMIWYMYCLTIEFKQIEIKSNHRRTVWEIMMLYAFVLTVKLNLCVTSYRPIQSRTIVI